MSRAEFETLAQFRYELRHFLRFSEEVTRRKGITPLQYQLILQIKGFPGRECATAVEPAERSQAKHYGVVVLIKSLTRLAERESTRVYAARGNAPRVRVI